MGPAPGPDATVQLGGPPAPVGPDPRAAMRLGSAPGPDATVQLGGAPAPGRPDPEATVRFGEVPPGAAEATVRLGSAPVPGPAPEQPYPAGGAPQPAGFESATFLDPEVWPTVPTPPPAAGPPVAAAAAPGATPAEGLQRFGPGVPPQAAAVWHGAAAVPEEPVRPRRRRRWLLIPVVLLVAVLAWLAWERYGRPVSVTGVTVRTDSAQGPACDGTAVVTGTLATDGGAGTVRYRWRRSDGTDSGILSQQVPSGRSSTEVVLRWTFQGKGTMQATATLEVLAPGSGTASVSFPYTCR
ncbi:hypothetical protein [Kitasatospora sp. NPDC059571]|uniref:hypothetical protein n=1 Tax=Kitasatospora sp. NPDC059571 TaxID=3346871 RepID=UPI003689A39A